MLHWHITQQDGGLEKPAAGRTCCDFALCHHGNAVALCLCQKVLYAVELDGSDQRSQIQVSGGWAGAQGLEGLAQTLQQRLVNALLDQNAGTR